MANEEMNIITLVDEKGNEHCFNLLKILEIDNMKYAVLAPEDQEEDDKEAVIFRVETDKGEEILVGIEDDNELSKVCEVLAAEIVDDMIKIGN